MKRAAWFVFLLLFALSAVPAFADLDGANVTVNYLYPEINDIYQVLGTGVVTPGGFNVNSFGQHDFTTFPSDLVLTNVAGEDINFSAADFNGYGLVVNHGGTAITGVSIAFNNISGFDLSRVTFDATDVWVNLQGLTTMPGEDFDLSLQFAPEPGSIALLGTGLVAAFGVVRRRLLQTPGIGEGERAVAALARRKKLGVGGDHPHDARPTPKSVNACLMPG